jgi:hypothetical protein
MLKMGILGLGSVVLSGLIYGYLPEGHTAFQQLLWLSVACGTAFSVYVLLSMLFKVPEVVSLWNILKKRWQRGNAPVTGSNVPG